MRHSRDATRNYSFHITPTHSATLAPQSQTQSTPTLFLPSGLAPIVHEPLNELEDNPDFQCNTGFDISSMSRPLLAGLGISYQLHQEHAIKREDPVFDGRPLGGCPDMLEDNLQLPLDEFVCESSETFELDNQGIYLQDTDNPITALSSGLWTSRSDLDFSTSSSSIGATQYSLGSTSSSLTLNASSSHDLMDDCSSFYDDLTYPSHDIGPFPDVNMYDLALARADPSGSVNPLDTIGITLNSPHDGPHDNVPLVSPIRPESQPPAEHPVQADLLADVIQNIVSIFTKSEAQECDNPSAAVSSLTKRHRSDDHLQFQSSNTELLTFPIMTSQEYTFPSDAQGSTLPEAIKTDKDNITAFQEIYPSPILNAHLGIQMDELVYRAERYRMRHTVNEIDKSWLMHFAGKLSERGELLDDFRCYIVGCGQVNKRRDHILVHVGAHIDQRPYTCTICGLRFLRKNECTRHEASHLGHRPYHCSICGQTFVRQDLVTRHLKRTHDTGKENCNRPPRKKARLQ